jgi:hypothetical protein
MDGYSAENGTPNGKIYVKFGPHETDEMPIEWAVKVLTNWRNKNPSQFGKALAEVVTGSRS